MDIPTYDFITSSRLAKVVHVDRADVILFDGILAFYSKGAGIQQQNHACAAAHRVGSQLVCHPSLTASLQSRAG